MNSELPPGDAAGAGDSGQSAFWIIGAGRSELRSASAPDPSEAQVRVRALYGAISRGTERLVFEGRVPASQRKSMRAPFQEGEFSFPLKYGYASVGRIEEGPRSGETVFCLHPHQSRYTLPEEAAVPVPAGVPPERAVLGANMETALNALWDARPTLGDRVAIVGAGLLGLLLGHLLARMGIAPTLIDPEPSRLSVAQGLGLRLVADAAAAPRECDLVVHTSATEAGLGSALGLAGPDATVLELSWFGDRAPRVPLGEAFHSQRLRLIASQVGQLPPARRSRWTRRRRLAYALTLLDEPRLDTLFSGESAFEHLPRDMAALLTDPGTLCHRIRYS